MPSSTHHHIHRIDSEHKHMHYWRVQVQCKNRIVIRPFSDRLHGGKRKALRAAIACRDALLEQMHDGQYNLWRRQRKRSNNTSGIVGVGRYLARETVGGKHTVRAFWQAFWNDLDGKRHGKKFAVKKYGDARAKAMAIQARRQALAEMSP